MNISERSKYVLLLENPKSCFGKRKRRKYDTINTSTNIETRDPGIRATRMTRVSVISLSHPVIITDVARFEMLGNLKMKTLKVVCQSTVCHNPE